MLLNKRVWMQIYFGLALSGFLWACQSDAPKATEAQKESTMEYILVGTYTKKEPHVNGQADGLYHFSFDPSTGKLQLANTTKGPVNPSFLSILPGQQLVYVANETGPDVDSVAHVSAYQMVAADQPLQLLNTQSSHSFAPCYVSTDKTGKYVFVANYVGGKVAIYPIEENGQLGPATKVLALEGSGPHAEQGSSHPHAVMSSPDNRYLYIPDKGADKIWIYEFEEGQARPAIPAYVSVQAGAGPRHMAFHPRQNFAYAVNELDATIIGFAYNPETGKLEEQQRISTLPESYSDFNACADIHLTPDGRFLYASNRGHNSIAVYQVDASSGLLTLMGHESTRGDFPRNFLIDKSGQYLLAANQNTDNIVVFSIAPQNGLLSYVSEVDCKTPVCLQQI
jgi:6-phosphogluconolactonase